MFWGDAQVDDDESLTINSPIVDSFEDMVVSDFFIPSTREWDVKVIREVFSEEECVRILKMTPRPVGSTGSMVWHFERNGRYSVKLAYRLADNLVHGGTTNHDDVWKVL